MFGNLGNKGGLFGNNNPTNSIIFGNNDNKNQTGFSFGNNQANIGFANNNNFQSQPILFGNNNNQPNNKCSWMNNHSSIDNNNNNGGILGNNNSNNNNMNLNNQQIPNSEFYTTVTPVIALSQNNEIRNIQLKKLPPIFQEAVLKLKLNLQNQEIKLDELQRYSQRLIDLIEQSNISVDKLNEFNGFINQKLNKYELIVNQIKDNFNFITESFEEEQANIQLMEQDLGYKIEIPSKFLINYSQNLYKRTTMFQQRLNDVITLIKLILHNQIIMILILIVILWNLLLLNLLKL